MLSIIYVLSAIICGIEWVRCTGHYWEKSSNNSWYAVLGSLGILVGMAQFAHTTGILACLADPEQPKAQSIIENLGTIFVIQLAVTAIYILPYYKKDIARIMRALVAPLSNLA